MQSPWLFYVIVQCAMNLNNCGVLFYKLFVILQVIFLQVIFENWMAKINSVDIQAI